MWRWTAPCPWPWTNWTQINENSPEPMGGPELQTVYAHYAELQAYYESEPEYFGLPCPYFTSKDTETSPIGAILAVAGIPQAAIDAGDSRTIPAGGPDHSGLYRRPPGLCG